MVDHYQKNKELINRECDGNWMARNEEEPMDRFCSCGGHLEEGERVCGDCRYEAGRD